MIYLAIKWVDFPWRTVSHNQMVYIYIYILLVGGLEHGFYDFSIQLGMS